MRLASHAAGLATGDMAGCAVTQEVDCGWWLCGWLAMYGGWLCGWPKYLAGRWLTKRLAAYMANC